MYVFIGCADSKKNYQCKAEELYSESAIFRKSLAYARKLVDDKDIYIISAKHHVVNLSDILKPYSVTLKNMSVDQRKAWAEEVLAEFKKRHISPDHKALFLCGEYYYGDLKDYFRESETPWKGRWFAEIMTYLDRKIGTNESKTLYDYILHECATK